MLLCAQISATGCVFHPPEFTQPLPTTIREWLSALSGGIFTGLFTRLGAFSLSLSLSSAVDCADNSAGKNFFAPSSFLPFLSYAEKDIARQSPLATPLQKCLLSWTGEGNAAGGGVIYTFHLRRVNSQSTFQVLSTALWSKSRIENLGLCFLMSSLSVGQRALTPNCIGLELCNVPLSHLRTMLLKGSDSQPLRSNSPITLLSP